MTDIKDKLQEAMSLRGMKASELARRSGLNKGIISRYLRGKAKPKPDSVDALAIALGVSPTWLLGYDTNTPPTISFEVDTDRYLDLNRLNRKNRLLATAYYQALLDTQEEIPK